jgi:hypothetical protein
MTYSEKDEEEEHFEALCDGYEARIADQKKEITQLRSMISELVGWQPIDSAPRDGTPILGWCNHEEDPYQDPENPDSITIYAAHADALSRVENGPNVLIYGGAVDDHPDDGGAFIPDWWFLFGSDFEVAANPTHWMPIKPPHG